MQFTACCTKPLQFYPMEIYILLQRNKHSYFLGKNKFVQCAFWIIPTNFAFCVSKSKCIACLVKSWHFLFHESREKKHPPQFFAISIIACLRLHFARIRLHENRLRCTPQESNDICIYLLFILLLFFNVCYFNKIFALAQKDADGWNSKNTIWTWTTNESMYTQTTSHFVRDEFKFIITTTVVYLANLALVS